MRGSFPELSAARSFLVLFVALTFSSNALQASESVASSSPDPKPPEEDSFDLEVDDAGPVEMVTPTGSVAAVEPHATLCRSLTIPSAYMAAAGTLQFTVDHRAFRPIRYREHWYQNAFEDALGLDGGALKIGLALRYAFTDYLDLSVTRQNGVAELFDTYDSYVRVRLLRADQSFVGLVLGAGVSWFYQPRIDDAVAWNGFVALRVPFAFGLEVGGLVAGSSDSTGSFKRTGDTNGSLAAGGSLAYRPLDWLEVRADTLAPIAGYGGGWPAITGGVSFLTWRHAFTLLVSNTQYVTLDAIPTGSHLGPRDVIIGFTILRQWD